MTPTLWGRMQTRVLVVLAVGICWTLVVAPFLPAGGASLGDLYATTLAAVFLTAFFGVIIWEPIYHLIQQYRWEKDWPTGLGLVTMVPEGLLVLAALGDNVALGTFLLHFVSTWLLIWFFINGPLRVLLPRWRFRGGRIF